MAHDQFQILLVKTMGKEQTMVLEPKSKWIKYSIVLRQSISKPGVVVTIVLWQKIDLKVHLKTVYLHYDNEAKI